MPAFRLLGWQQPPELVEVAVPEPGPGQVRVRVAGCGLCHSDLAMAEMPGEIGRALGWHVPFTLGHETAGWIDAVGPGTDGAWSQGAGVALASPTSCGRCRWCRRGQENACLHGAVGRGYGRDGGLSGYVLVDDLRALLPLEDLDPATAEPLTDAGATSYHAVRRVLAHLHEDGTAVVFGVGGLGAFVVQILRAVSPARVVAVDPSPLRRALASELGAHQVLDGVDDRTGECLRAVLGGQGADAVIDLVGTDETITAGVGALGAGGALAVVGAAGGTLRRSWYAALPRDGAVFTFQGSDLSDARNVIQLAASGSVVTPVEAFALDAVGDAYAALGAGALTGRAVVHP